MSFSTLITCEALQALTAAGGNDLVILDCRFDLADPAWGEAQYRLGHLSGAQFVDLARDLSAAVVPGVTGRHPLPSRGALADTLARLGVSKRAQVVVYDDKGGMFAARAWWLLKYLGHEQVALLDGGLLQWLRLGYPLSTEQKVAERGDFSAGESLLMTAEVEDVVGAAERGAVLLDARAADRYRGENETIDPVAGHIPGALSAPFMENLDEQGLFKSLNELEKTFSKVAPGLHSEVIVYCGSGVTAAHDVLAMRCAGYENVRLYAGSWSHWITDQGRAVATGA